MPPLASVDGALWLINFLLTPALAIRIIRLDLARKFPFFLAFLLFAILRSLILIPFVGSTSQYSRIWGPTELVVLLLLTLSTLEIYSKVLHGYPGVQSLGRWVTVSGLSVGLIVAFLTAGITPDVSGRIVTLALVLTVDRGVYFGLTAVILLMSLFLLWYPVPTPRNMVVHSFLFALYFLSKAFVILVRTVRGADLHPLFSELQLVFGMSCLCAWMLLLRRDSEDPQVTFGRRWNPTEETRLISQLRSINSSLGRLSRD